MLLFGQMNCGKASPRNSSVGRAGDCRWLQLISLGHWFDSGCADQLFAAVCPCGLMDKALPSGGRDCGFESRLGLFFVRSKDWYERLHGAMATRRIPDPKIGGSIPSGVSSFFVFLFDKQKKLSKAGNRTRVSCVTGRNTNHYTTSEEILCKRLPVSLGVCMYMCVPT